MAKSEEKVFTLRINNKVFDAVKVSAFRNKRSISKEIEFILEKEYHIEPKWIDPNKLSDND